MAHHRPDDTPPGAAAPPAAVALPGGPDGTSGPVPPPYPAALGLTAWPTAPGLVLAASALGVGPKARGVRVSRPRGSSKGRRPAAAPAAKIAAIADPSDLVGGGGAGVPSVNPAAGTGDESTVPVTDVTPLLAPVTLSTGAGDGAAKEVGVGV
jgi:hypothetical protein